jgi:phage terminase large subunit
LELIRRGPALPATGANDFTAYRERPVEFVRDILGADPWERQADILQALACESRVTVRSCNNAGKTLCAAWAALWFLQTRPGSIVVTTAPTTRQVKDLLWRRIRAAFNGARTPLNGRCLTQMLECGTDWYATGFSTDEEVNFQGPHSPHGVLFIGDEASGLAEWLFQAASGFMTEAGAKMLLIGNPNVASGYFYNSHLTWPDRQRFHISAFDVPEHVLRPAWKVQMLEDYGEDNPAYQVRVLGEFPEQGEDSLISLKWINDAQERSEQNEDRREPSSPFDMGVDIARFGSDESVAYVRQGGRVTLCDHWRGNDTMASAGRIAALAGRVAARTIKVDEIGVGAGVLDRLREQGIPAEGINVGEAAFDKEHYANRRSEIFWDLRERFRTGDIAIPKDDDLLMAQLVALKFTYTSRGQIKLESKEDMAKRRGTAQGWASPDRADALAIAFAAGRPFALPVAGAGLSKGLRDTPLRPAMEVRR